MNNIEMARPAQKLNLIKKSQVGGSKLNQQIITGTLTSRIETRDKEGKFYYYGFFKLSDQSQEIPVIWKQKPTITKGNQAEILGNWAKSSHSRPSFTCQAYQILKDPPANQVQINCFYNSKFSPCSFTTNESQLMEKHYRQKHYAKAKEVYRG